MTSLLVNPTLEQVNAELARLCDAANKGQRSRTADMRIDAAEWAAPVALYRSGGAGVPNSYRQAATTTVVGCAWADRDGTRLVRLEASRTYAPKSSYGRREALPFRFNTAVTFWDRADEADVTATAPELSAVWAEVEPAKNDGGFDAAYIVFRRDDLSVLADWLDDRGLPTAAIRGHLARFAPAACGC